MNHWKKTWACDHLKLVICQRITLKNTRPRWVDTWARGTVRWYWSADTLFWQLSIDHNIDVQLVFSWAPKLASKCESKHWLPCGADGRTGVRSRDYQICWVGRLSHFLSYGAKREARAWAELRYNAICGQVIEFIHSSHHGFSRGRSCTTSLGWEWWLS